MFSRSPLGIQGKNKPYFFALPIGALVALLLQYPHALPSQLGPPTLPSHLEPVSVAHQVVHLPSEVAGRIAMEPGQFGTPLSAQDLYKYPSPVPSSCQNGNLQVFPVSVLHVTLFSTMNSSLVRIRFGSRVVVVVVVNHSA